MIPVPSNHVIPDLLPWKRFDVIKDHAPMFETPSSFLGIYKLNLKHKN